MTTKACFNYSQQFENLLQLVSETEAKAVSGQDEYFTNNLNFFCKSFLITLCSYLESYLKEAASVVISEMNARLQANPVPHNIIKWHFDKKNTNTKEFQFKQLLIQISEAEIDESISGNVYKTTTLFGKLGIDLNTDEDFKEKKETISSIVSKRNKIVHYNDAASDLSLSDIKTVANNFKEYINCIDKIMINAIYPCITQPFNSEAI
jgi:hypothetical protein